jgi:catechol 2,3-dioxygenase-like lactoylglutathione lyase family enzyme
MRYGSDHHAMVLFSKPVMDVRADRKFMPEVTINQITWQCGSLKEITSAHSYFEEQQVAIQRVGRDMPGSNWHVYVYDPDGHTNELYYGIEQIGWNGRSKPRDMYYRDRRGAGEGHRHRPGHRPDVPKGETYDVEGILLARPFKITKIGPVSLFVDDVDSAEAFYSQRLGLTRSEDAEYRGARCVFLRCGSEHHSLALFPKELRQTLGLRPDTTCMSFGVELGSYAQLRAAVKFLKERGCTLIDSIPPELYPGIDYSAFALDPDGHCIQLYYYMEQIGWDGRVRPASERRKVNGGQWPETLDPLSDTYADQVFQGPLG